MRDLTCRASESKSQGCGARRSRPREDQHAPKILTSRQIRKCLATQRKGTGNLNSIADPLSYSKGIMAKAQENVAKKFRDNDGGEAEAEADDDDNDDDDDDDGGGWLS